MLHFFFFYARLLDALPRWLWLGKYTGITRYYIDLSPFDIVLVLLQSWSQISSEKLKRENIRNSFKNIIIIWENSKKKKRKERANLSEGELKRGQATRGARSIGSGTFGDCYPGKYRGISVVIKEYKEILAFPFYKEKQDTKRKFCNNQGIFCLASSWRKSPSVSC